MQLFLDESGFTGEDLANTDQPVFVLASTCANEELCRGIYSEVFRGISARELKHSSLAKTSRGRQRILDFFRKIRASRLFAVWVAHKEFCLLTKLVDLWLEPALFEHGIDFYHRGGARSFSNMAWFCLRTFESPAFVSRHLRAFQSMLRSRTLAHYRSFWNDLRQASTQCETHTREILDYFLLSEFQLGHPHLATLPEKSLDICLSSALQVVGYWRGQTEGDLEVIHDRSSTMAKEKWMWDALTAFDLPACRVGPSDFPVQYPLRVTQTEFAESSMHLQLQFADIVAGAFATHARSRISGAGDNHYVEELTRAGLTEHLVGGIWPAPNVEPDELEPGTIGAGEFLKIASAALHRAKQKRGE